METKRPGGASCQRVGGKLAAARFRGAFEQQPFNPDVIVEPLEVPDDPKRAARVNVEGGRRVRRERNVMGLGERGGAKKAGDPEAAGRVRLKDIHCARLEHPAEVPRVVAVLAGADLQPGGGAIAQQAQSLEIVRGDGLLESAHTFERERFGEGERLFAVVRAVRVDE